MAGNRADRRVRTAQEKEKRLKKNRNESRSSSEGTRGRVRRQMHRRRVAPTRNHCRASGKMRSAIVYMERRSCGNVRKRTRTSNVTRPSRQNSPCSSRLTWTRRQQSPTTQPRFARSAPFAALHWLGAFRLNVQNSVILTYIFLYI